MRMYELCLMLGRLWGRLVLKHPLTRFRRRAELFDLTVIGEDKLQALDGRGFLIVSNHIRPHDSPLGPLANLQFVRQYQFSADSFVFSRLIQERASRSLTTVAQCDRGALSPHPWKRLLQHRVGQPFAIGQLEALPGYIPVESRPGASQRRFLTAMEQAIGRREAILIFPGPIPLEDDGTQSDLEPGAAHISRKYGLPILPACIVGSDSWRPGQPITVIFGEHFCTTGMTKAQVSEEIIRRVRVLHAAHTRPAEVLPDAPGGVGRPTARRGAARRRGGYCRRRSKGRARPARPGAGAGSPAASRWTTGRRSRPGAPRSVPASPAASTSAPRRIRSRRSVSPIASNLRQHPLPITRRFRVPVEGATERRRVGHHEQVGAARRRFGRVGDALAGDADRRVVGGALPCRRFAELGVPVGGEERVVVGELRIRSPDAQQQQERRRAGSIASTRRSVQRAALRWRHQRLERRQAVGIADHRVGKQPLAVRRHHAARPARL